MFPASFFASLSLLSYCPPHFVASHVLSDWRQLPGEANPNQMLTFAPHPLSYLAHPPLDYPVARSYPAGHVYAECGPVSKRTVKAYYLKGEARDGSAAERTRYYVKLRRKKSAKTYAKGDLWVVSSGLGFEPRNTVVGPPIFVPFL